MDFLKFGFNISRGGYNIWDNKVLYFDFVVYIPEFYSLQTFLKERLKINETSHKVFALLYL